MRHRIAILATLALVTALLPGSATASTLPEEPPELLLTWGGYGSGAGQFNGTADVGVGPNGLVYVLDGGNHRVQVFDRDGTFRFAWGSYGSGDGQFRVPDGIAFDTRNGHESVYVMEYWGHRIQKFDLDGNFIWKSGRLGGREGQFNQPSGGAVDADGDLYVADRVNHRIQVFDDQGNFQFTWGWGVDTGANQLEVCTSGCFRGRAGTNPSQFVYPTGVAFDSAGDVYVAGHWRHAVHIFRPDGTFMTEWSTGPAHNTVGIAIDSADNVYTVSWGAGDVYKNTTSGELLTMWGAFNYSHGVAVDAEGYVYVADTRNHLVHKYASPNEAPYCEAAFASLETLWPPNHEFVPIDVLGVTDPDDDPIIITIDSIFQDEPVDSTGDGAFVPDGQGIGTTTAEVRAERDGAGNGRVYHIGFDAEDGKGGSCSGEVLVGVPASQGKKGAPVDGGALYDSTVTG